MFPSPGSNLLSSFYRSRILSNIILMGPPGCGKTSIGRIISKKLNMKWIDVDDDILEKEWKMSVSDKLSLISDNEFLDLEESTVKKMNNNKDCIISLSGSVPLRSLGLKTLSKNGLIIYLDTDINNIINRLEKMKVNRIVGHKNRELFNVLKERNTIYENSYDIRVFIHSNDTLDDISNNVISSINLYNRNYSSTRGNDKNQSFHQTLISGLAKDNGLYLPESWDIFKGLNELTTLLHISYPDLCLRVLEKFSTLPPWRLRNACNNAYKHFNHPDILPLTKLSDDSNEWILETYHGPTASFKDLSLQLLPHLFKHSLIDFNESKKPAILVATSGDTGSAALHGFGMNSSYPMIVLYPENGVSSVQKAQMIRAPKNVCVLGVTSDFDNCQQLVKSLLSNSNIDLPLSYTWTSANSINFGRLLPQICFSVQSYLSLVKNKTINIGDPIDITIPTGNFGFIFGVTIAKNMGIPIRNIICASNDNNVLTDFIQTGIFDISKRQFKKTISPAIDILIPSNLERWLYILLKENTNNEIASLQINEYMNNLKTKGYFKVSNDIHTKIKNIIKADWCSEKQCLDTIKGTWNKYNKLIDPHTAVGLYVSNKYKTKDIPMIIASTANWAKFPETIIEALYNNNPDPNLVKSHISLSLEDQYNKICNINPNLISIPNNLLNLIHTSPKHNKVINTDINELKKEIQSYISLIKE